MPSPFEKDLAGLKEKLLIMASHAETATRQAVEFLTERNEQCAAEVKKNEDVLDRFEVEVDEQAIQLLGRASLAADFRLIIVAMRISWNLERIGDEASKIAKRARELLQEAPLKEVTGIPQLADLALGLLKRALDAFVRLDSAVARALIPEDRKVDALNREIYRALAAQMMEKPETVARALNLMVAAKSLERIADHAKNIAEETVYLCEARDIRHTTRPPEPGREEPTASSAAPLPPPPL
ncbi:MAG TPA: phosphate signaling complex protein PhoU [Verrucomicrobiota bacterium]|jgi:phosphate transport system protein|nr:phosphate signaling complex protein PhoU [Verrucomicrobiota bacterium]HRT06767.1 phosphate signaling complex protein PhoU [Candidatus Paceibacterota bacterium]